MATPPQDFSWTTLAKELGAMLLYLTAAVGFFQGSIFPMLSSVYNYILRGRDYVHSYVHYDIPEAQGYTTNEFFADVQLYLSNIAANTPSTSRLTLVRPQNCSAFTYGLSPENQISDSFNNVTVVWEYHVEKETATRNNHPGRFSLRFRKEARDLLLPAYLDRIKEAAEEIRNRERELQLYTNCDGPWSPVTFKHPSTFDTLAIEPTKKEEIIKDLRDFADRGNAFYQRTGRAWKRGYLLYGPPGTGKSSMIAAMANYLGYDIYDLELTQVSTNSELRTLIMETTSKSIIVIEDIDCSVDLTERGKQQTSPDLIKPSSITLSGLLNCTDGLWSCCGSERIFLFTTNHIENVDPALLRPGRMDMHIHMGYCSFPALKIMMYNYLGFEEEDYKANNCVELMDEVKAVIDEAVVTPADVSEMLIKKRRLKIREAVEEILEELREREIKSKAKKIIDHAVNNVITICDEREHKKRTMWKTLRKVKMTWNKSI